MLLCFSYDTKLTTALQESVHRSVDSSLQFTPKESQFPILKERDYDKTFKGTGIATLVFQFVKVS